MEYIAAIMQKAVLHIFDESYKRNAAVISFNTGVELIQNKSFMNLLNNISSEYFYSLESLDVEGHKVEIIFKVDSLDRFGLE